LKWCGHSLDLPLSVVHSLPLLPPWSDAAKEYCHMAFHITVKRKPEWYLSNVILVSWMIVSASSSVFCISEDSMAERLGIIFT
jgi:hypothetical protein